MAGSACGAAHFNRLPFRVTTHCTGAAGRAAFNFQLIHGGPVNGNVIPTKLEKNRRAQQDGAP